MISPQGYNLGEEPKSKNPFWDGEGEDSDVNRIYATAEITGGTGTPSVQTSKTVSGHDITFGFSFNNLRGEPGQPGAPGAQGPAGPAGATGATGAQGPAGPAGERGPAGETGPAGPTGATGPAGPAGADGQDGVSPTIDVVTITGGHRVDITDAQGTESFNILDGQNGAPGQNGQDGVTPNITMSATADATSSSSPTVTVTKGGTTANPNFALAFSGLKGETGQPGTPGATGPAGPAGPTGATGPAGPAGPGVPTGGTAGQVLTKVNGTDYNTQWVTPRSGGTTFQSISSALGSATQIASWGSDMALYRAPLSDSTLAIRLKNYGGFFKLILSMGFYSIASSPVCVAADESSNAYVYFVAPANNASTLGGTVYFYYTTS